MNFFDKASDKAGSVFDSARETFGEVRTGISNAVDEFPQDVPTLIAKIKELRAEKAQMLDQWQEEKKREFRAMIQSKLDRLFDHSMNVLSDHVKETIKDPFMPNFVANMVDDAVDAVWPDVKIEVKDKLLTGVSSDPILGHGEPPRHIFWIPAKIRYALQPYDKSIWGAMRNPLWWLILLFSLVPRYGIGQITYIVLFLFLDRSDEFQMFRYIVDFKALQFITLGVLNAIIGAAQYYFCTSVVPPNCDTQAPMEDLWTLAIFVLQTIVVWIAFLFLSNSEKKGGAHFLMTQESRAALLRTCHTPEQRRLALEQISSSNEVLVVMTAENEKELLLRTRRRMRSYLIYDLIIFLLCVGFACWIAFANLLDSDANVNFKDRDTFTRNNWKFLMSLYWIKTLFGILSFPFALLAIPLISSLLTHAKPTGYNPYGNTVKFLGKPDEGVTPWEAKSGGTRRQDKTPV